MVKLRAATFRSVCRDMGSFQSRAGGSVHDAGLTDVAITDQGSHGYDYDLFVIGGGSGGLACSKEAASHGVKVCMFKLVVTYIT